MCCPPLPHHYPEEILILKLVHTQALAIHPNFRLHAVGTPGTSAPGKSFLAVTIWISLTLQISEHQFALWPPCVGPRKVFGF